MTVMQFYGVFHHSRKEQQTTAYFNFSKAGLALISQQNLFIPKDAD